MGEPPEPGYVLVARSDEVPERGRIVVAIGDLEIGIFRIGGELRAYDNYCQHAGGPVCQGMLVSRVTELLAPDRTSLGDRFHPDDLHIVCPWHGYEYDVRTGRHPASPDVRLKPRAVREAEGMIHVACS